MTTNCNESIRAAVKDYAAELLRDALENGNVSETADRLREGIRQGWIAALMEIEPPQEFMTAFRKL